jgi:hypothetical protein
LVALAPFLAQNLRHLLFQPWVAPGALEHHGRGFARRASRVDRFTA